MHSLQQRANIVFSFALTTIGCVLAIIAAISAITGYPSIHGKMKIDPASLRVVSRRYGPDHYDYGTPKSHFGRMAFDIEADFTPVFNWNTKQVFVTVVADYVTPTHDRNSVVLWDRIITSKENARIKLRNVPNKYALVDFSRKWSNQQANVSIHWDITPHVGILQSGHSASHLASIVLPPASS